eukprot:91697-Amorphochlora_amoeboformis.AAC.1
MADSRFSRFSDWERQLQFPYRRERENISMLALRRTRLGGSLWRSLRASPFTLRALEPRCHLAENSRCSSETKASVEQLMKSKPSSTYESLLFTSSEVQRLCNAHGVVPIEKQINAATIQSRQRDLSISQAQEIQYSVTSRGSRNDSCSCDMNEVSRADLREMQLINSYIYDFLAKPAEGLGRKGAVCPFVPKAIKNDALYLSVCRSSTFEAVKQTMEGHIVRFNGLSPRKNDKNAKFKAIVVAFPEVPLHQVKNIIDRVQRALKLRCIDMGLMIGEFHLLNPTSGLHSDDFFPLRTVSPVLAIRHMVPSDIAFMTQAHCDRSFQHSAVSGFMSQMDREGYEGRMMEKARKIQDDLKGEYTSCPFKSDFKDDCKKILNSTPAIIKCAFPHSGSAARPLRTIPTITTRSLSTAFKTPAQSVGNFQQLELRTTCSQPPSQSPYQSPNYPKRHLVGTSEVERKGFELVVRWETTHAVGFTAVKTFGGGRAGGGTRIRAYGSEEEAMDDAMALALNMQRKHDATDMALGGAKTTVMLKNPDNVQALYNPSDENSEAQAKKAK